MNTIPIIFIKWYFADWYDLVINMIVRWQLSTFLNMNKKHKTAYSTPPLIQEHPCIVNNRYVVKHVVKAAFLWYRQGKYSNNINLCYSNENTVKKYLEIYF